VAAALSLSDDYYESVGTTLQAKRDRICAGLRQVGFDVFVPQGTYFVTTDIRPLGYDDGLDFCLNLPARCGVVAIPLDVFYDDKAAGRSLVRWAFCKQDAVLDEAISRLSRLRS
jgi:N-succinyldiaminopimelate aminotransferase